MHTTQQYTGHVRTPRRYCTAGTSVPVQVRKYEYSQCALVRVMADLNTMSFTKFEIFWVVFAGVSLVVLAVTIVLVLVGICIIFSCNARARDRTARENDLLAADHGHVLEATHARNPCVPFSGDAVLPPPRAPPRAPPSVPPSAPPRARAPDDAPPRELAAGDDVEPSAAGNIEEEEGVHAVASASGERNPMWRADYGVGEEIQSFAFDGDVTTIGLREDASERAITMTSVPEEGAEEQPEQPAISSTAAAPADAEARSASPPTSQRTGVVYDVDAVDGGRQTAATTTDEVPDEVSSERRIV